MFSSSAKSALTLIYTGDLKYYRRGICCNPNRRCMLVTEPTVRGFTLLHHYNDPCILKINKRTMKTTLLPTLGFVKRSWKPAKKLSQVMWLLLEEKHLPGCLCIQAALMQSKVYDWRDTHISKCSQGGYFWYRNLEIPLWALLTFLLYWSVGHTCVAQRKEGQQERAAEEQADTAEVKHFVHWELQNATCCWRLEWKLPVLFG